MRAMWAMRATMLPPPLAGMEVERRMNSLARNTARGVLGIVLAAAANWLANYLIDRIFGPEEEYD